MARGESGRIVLEVDPSAKDELYAALVKDGMTLKEWFLRQATQYLKDRNQPTLFGGMSLAETPTTYKTAEQPARRRDYKKKIKGK